MKPTQADPIPQNDTSKRGRSFISLLLAHLRQYTTGEWYYPGDQA